MLLHRTQHRALVVTLLAALVLETAGAPAVAIAVEPSPLQEAQPEAESTELVELRTSTSQTVDNYDGTLTTSFFTDPVFYQPAGRTTYEPIDLSFGAGDGGSLVADKAPVSVALARDTGLVVANDNVSITLLPLADAEQVALGSAEPARAGAGPTAELPEAFPGADLRVFAQPDGAATFLVLEAPPAEPAWTFALDASGLVATATKVGSIEFIDEAGSVVAALPAPYAVDSTTDELTGSGRTTTAASYTLGPTDDGGQTVTLRVDDQEWLKAATYPVYVDPVVTIYVPGTTTYGDAHVNQGNPTFNYGNYQRPDSPFYDEIWLGESPSDPTYYNEAFLRFDLTSLAGTTIDVAELQVYPYHQYYNAPTATNTWLRRVTASWAENTITWNTKPPITTTGTIVAGLVEGARSSFIITSMVQGWVSATFPNYGLRLDENGNGETYWKRLISSEYATNTSPRLNVTYHTPTATPTYPTAGGPTSGRTLSWVFADTSTHTQTDFHVDVSTTSAFSSILATSGDVASAADGWAIPSATSLTAGTTYYWRAKVRDGHSWSPWSATASFVHEPNASLGLQAHNAFEEWDLGGGDTLAVNVATANLIVSHPLVSLPIRGGALPVGLAYNSFDASNVGLGAGWRLDLQRRLFANAGGSVTFTDGDGSRHTFTAPLTVGTVTTYTRPATLHATLVKDTAVTANEFSLTYKDRSRDRFDIAGSDAFLEKVEDRHGNTVTIAYGTGANISSVTDPAGRVVTFTWDTTPTPDRLTQIQDWAWVSGGEVQSSATGARRAYRFFFDGSGRLAGWSDPVNTAGSCPTGGSHLTCLTYGTNGLVATIGKTQSLASAACGWGGCVQPVTTSIAYAGTEPREIKDAEQVVGGTLGTVLSRPAAGQLRVVRQGTPASTTTYGQPSSTDAYGRIQSVWRAFQGGAIETRTVWDSAQIVAPASVTDNYGALFSTPARTVSYTYLAGSMGNVSRMVEPLTASPATNRWTDSTYNANNDVTQQIVSQDGSATLRTTTRFCYDAACAISATGLTLLRQIDNYVDGTAGGAGGNATDVSTDYLYDPSANGQLTRESRRNYDAAGALLDARAIGYVYDANGNQTAEIANYVDGDTLDPDDATPNPTTLARTDLSTAYGYDTAGNLVSVADPRRAIEAPAGADDYVSRTAYDALNRRVRETTPTTPGLQITCPVGNPTCREATWGYDELGGLMVATDYGKVDTGARYDRVGRAIETIEMTRGLISAKSTGLTGYDAAGRVVWTKNRQQVGDATLGRTETNYDELGRPIDVTEAAASSPDVATTTRTTYDALDRVTSVETGVGTGTGQTTATAYDLGGRTVQTNDEFGCATSTFDYRGLGLTKTEGKTPAATCTGTGSRTLTNTYDGLGRLTRTEITASITAGEIGTRTTDVVLDAAGNTRSSAVGGGTTFTVNRLDQTVAEIRPAGATAKTTFDAAGNQVDRCFWSTSTAEVCQAADYGGYADAPDTASTTTYDARNQRVGLKTPDAGETTYDPGHDYAPAANYLEIGSNVEAQTLYDYDDRHRLTSITHQSCAVTPGTHTCTGSVTSLGSDAYEYDDDSRTRVVESNGATSFDRHYCYDALDQLTSVRSSAGCASGLLESYAYDDASNRTSKTVSGATTTYAHDAEGQLTSCSPSCGTISYDAAGRTATWNGWYLAYDGEGRLASACKASGCPGTADQVTMTYDGEGHRTSLTVKPANQAATTTTFRYQGDAVVEESVGGTVTRRYVVDEGGTIVKLVIPAGQANSGEYLVTWNGHGDATGLWRVDAGGALTLANSYAYDTWGRPTTAPHNSVPDLGFRFLYVGRFDVQWDRALGLDLTYMHARHYSPALGRFLQPDPAASETHFYRYGGNSPIVNIDPDGKLFWVIAVAVVRVAVWVGPRVATLTRVIKFSVPKVARSGSVVPKWVKNAGTAANWAKNLGNAFKSNGTIPTVRTIRALIEVARKYKLPIECHTGRYHPPPWNIPHLHIGKPARFHVPLPPGWTPPGIVCT